jgi:hypothetical protein
MAYCWAWAFVTHYVDAEPGHRAGAGENKEVKMSDLSPLDQSFALPPAGLLPLPGQALYAPPSSNDVQPHEITFRQLRGEREIARILHLREEIQLSSAVRGDTAFRTREKKETTSAW